MNAWQSWALLLTILIGVLALGYALERITGWVYDRWQAHARAWARHPSARRRFEVCPRCGADVWDGPVHDVYCQGRP